MSRNLGTLRTGKTLGRRHRSLNLSPNILIAAAAALALVIGIGIYSAVSSAQAKAAEEAAREQKAQEQRAWEESFPDPVLLPNTFAPVSTPRSEWQRGQMPHLYQTDVIWSEQPYGGDTVRANACGPTALTMVYVYLTGKTDLDPASMAAFSDSYGYAPTGATEWAFMTEGASMLGLYSWAIPVTRTDIASALDAGQPVICTVTPGDFTNVGHYIVLKSIDGTGKVEVFDPNSALNSIKKWDIQRIINQTANCWAFSA